MDIQAHKRRFMDPGKTIRDMVDEILVECPVCKACARIVVLEPGRRDWFAPRRLICAHCGYSRDWSEQIISRGWTAKPAVDDFFHAPLWLQSPCGNEILWAYNLKHLALIEAYVAAHLREHRERLNYGWQNSSLLNRLPRWISASSNRDKVLRTIQKLKAK